MLQQWNTVVDYKIVENEKEDKEEIKTTYTVNYYLMNQDMKNYSLERSITHDANVKDKVIGQLIDFEGYIRPREMEITITEGENVINYYYDRKK